MGSDLSVTELSFQQFLRGPSIHSTCCGAAAELIARRQWGTVSIGQGNGLARRGCCLLNGLVTLPEAADDVFPMHKAKIC